MPLTLNKRPPKQNVRVTTDLDQSHRIIGSTRGRNCITAIAPCLCCVLARDLGKLDFIDLIRVPFAVAKLFRLLVIIPLIVFANSVKAGLLRAYGHEFNSIGNAFVCLKYLSGVISFW